MTIEEKKTMDVLRNDNISLATKIQSLNRQIGGYRTSNGNYLRRIEELKQRVEHYKQLGIEGDKMYEEKLSEVESLKAELLSATKKVGELTTSLENKNNYVKSLQDKTQDLISEKNRLEANEVDLKAKIREMETTIAQLKRPWYKKLF